MSYVNTLCLDTEITQNLDYSNMKVRNYFYTNTSFIIFY